MSVTQKVMSENLLDAEVEYAPFILVESDIDDVSKIKLRASNTATMADAPFILDQKRDNCYPKSNV